LKDEKAGGPMKRKHLFKRIRGRAAGERPGIEYEDTAMQVMYAAGEDRADVEALVRAAVPAWNEAFQDHPIDAESPIYYFLKGIIDAAYSGSATAVARALEIDEEQLRSLAWDSPKEKRPLREWTGKGKEIYENLI
jgi:hypothetical protein